MPTGLWEDGGSNSVLKLQDLTLQNPLQTVLPTPPIGSPYSHKCPRIHSPLPSPLELYTHTHTHTEPVASTGSREAWKALELWPDILSQAPDLHLWPPPPCSSPPHFTGPQPPLLTIAQSLFQRPCPLPRSEFQALPTDPMTPVCPQARTPSSLPPCISAGRRLALHLGHGDPAGSGQAKSWAPGHLPVHPGSGGQPREPPSVPPLQADVKACPWCQLPGM